MDHKQSGTCTLFDVGICITIVLFPSMPHIRNTKRTRKPWTRIFYNTIEHPFSDCISKVLRSDFFSLVNRVFPEPTFVQSPPVRFGNLFYVARDFENELPDSQGIRDCWSLHMAFADSKYTFRPRPLLHQLLWRQSKIVVKAKAQLNGHEIWYDRTTGLFRLHFILDHFTYIFHVLLTRLPHV